jgi:hypothetical protein
LSGAKPIVALMGFAPLNPSYQSYHCGEDQ